MKFETLLNRKNNYLKRLYEKYNDKFEYLNFDENINTNSLIDVKCNKCNNIFKIFLNYHLNITTECPFCYKINKKQEILEKLKNKFGDQFLYDEVDYINNKEKLRLKCSKCKKIIEENTYILLNHLRGKYKKHKICDNIDNIENIQN